MAMEASGKDAEANRLFTQAWNEATADFEKFLAAYYLARQQEATTAKLQWYETALRFARSIDDDSVKSAYPYLYLSISECYGRIGNTEQAQSNSELAKQTHTPSDKGPFYHGTRAALDVGDMLVPGKESNYKSELMMNHIYFTAMVNGAGLAAALAKGDGDEHVYIVEPTGDFENDPNVTDKKFPGNPTRSYRTLYPLRIVGEAADWVRQTPEEIQRWRDKLAKSTGEIIN